MQGQAHHRRRLDGEPARVPGSDPDRLSEMSVSKVMTLTSTYDHRVIQGAQSGVYLARSACPAPGGGRLYDDIFGSLRIPYEPIRWAQDVSGRSREPDPEGGPHPGDDQLLPGAGH